MRQWRKENKMATKTDEIDTKSTLAGEITSRSMLGLSILEHKSSGYSLNLDLSYDDGDSFRLIDPREVSPLNCCFRVNSQENESRLIITGRNLEEYNKYLRNLKINPLLQYVEIGSGLGEFIPSIVKRYDGSLGHKPIIVDPAKYSIMEEMLKYAIDSGFCEGLNDKFSKWIERCETILDINKIILINSKLEKALVKHPWLNQVADVVIDHRGALAYPAIGESEENVLNLEKKLLKSGGLLVNDKI